MSAERAALATPLYPVPGGRVDPLRVALVCPPRVPAWIIAFQGLARGNPWLELTVVVVPDASLPSVRSVPAGIRAFVALEHALNGREAGLAPVATPVDDADRDVRPADRLVALQPELVLMLAHWAGFDPSAFPAPPLGRWHVDANLVDPRHAGLPLVDAIVRREAATQVALALVAGGAPPQVLASSWGRTRAPSFALQRRDAFRKVPPLLLRALHRLASAEASLPGVPDARLQLASPEGAPVRATGLRAALATLCAGARSLAGRHGPRRQWMLAVRRETRPLDPGAPTLGRHEIIRAPRGWWADPCVVDDAGRTLVFVEEMVRSRGDRARIACLELAVDGPRRLGVVLEEPGHLSYPQVFEWQGRWYLTVESNDARRVSLYRAEAFPLRWTRVCELVTDRVCVDPTLHHHEGRWYLFANVAENGNSRCDDLFLFVADDLEGPYRPHPVAPVVGDVRRARMAGRLFRHDGRLIRPAQDCAPRYGSAIVFNEVVELGPTVYRERRLGRCAPGEASWFKGFHTYSAAGGVEVLDALGFARERVLRTPASRAVNATGEGTAGDVAAPPGQPSA
ncbi:hypothetical protein GCM10028862_17480 [Luteimonas pelagia]